MKQTAPLKHYRRKRFLHKFLMMDSPRSAHLMGLGLFMLAHLLRAFGYIAVIQLVLRSGFDASSITSCALLFVLYALLLVSACLFLGSGKYDGIRHWQFRDLLTLGHWKKCWSAVFAAAAAALLIAWGESPPILAAALFSLVLFFVFAPDRRKIRKIALLPVLLAFLTLAGMFCGARLLEREIRSRQFRLARLVGENAPVNSVEYAAREKGGLSVHEEPLKTMRETRPGTPFFVWYHSPEEARQDLEQLRRENPRFIAAAEHFLALPVGFIREEFDSATGAYECYCGILREAARFQALLIQCAPDKATVVRADENLRKLREWCLASHSAIARLVAVSIEKIRLQALAGTLPRLNWSRREYAGLLGDAPDWDRALLCSTGDDTLQWLRHYPGRESGIAPGSPWDLYTLLDKHRLVVRSVKIAELALKKGMPYHEKREMLRKLDAPAGFIFSDLAGGMNENLLRHFVRVRDHRTMAEAAFALFEECRKNGAPPDHPQALRDLRDRWGNRPFGYEHGQITVDENTRRRGFRIFIAGPEKKNAPRDGIAVPW